MDSIHFHLFHISMDMICAVISVVGALLVSRYDRLSYLGWMCWLVSNIAWILWAMTMPEAPVWGVIVQNAFFLWTSIKGLHACRRELKSSDMEDRGTQAPLVLNPGIKHAVQTANSKAWAIHFAPE